MFTISRLYHNLPSLYSGTSTMWRTCLDSEVTVPLPHSLVVRRPSDVVLVTVFSTQAHLDYKHMPHAFFQNVLLKITFLLMQLSTVCL